MADHSHGSNSRPACFRLFKLEHHLLRIRSLEISVMIPTKVVITNRDDILGSVILALATRSAGKQIAVGMTKEYLKEKGFFVLQFRYHYQIERFTKFIGEYVPLHMQSLITISPFSN